MLGQPSLQYRKTLQLRIMVLVLQVKNSRKWSSQLNLPLPLFVMQGLDSAQVAVNTIVSFILAMIATIIGVNLIGPVATAVGGALNNKNLTGAANSLTAQITLLFVVVVILGVVIFIAVLGKMASAESA